MKLQLKRSNVLEGGFAKAPTALQVEYGELAVNYNDADPCIFMKDSTDNIIRISSGGVPILSDSNAQSGTLDDRYTLKSGGQFTGNIEIGSGIDLNTDGTASFLGGAVSFATDTSVFKQSSKLSIQNSSTNSETIALYASGNASYTGKVTSAATASGDTSTTLATKGYVDSTNPSVGNGTITIVQPGVSNQTFTTNQSGNKTITLKNDNTVPSVGNGTITITQPGTSNQTFSVNQSGNTTIALRNDNSTYSIGNGTVTITQNGSNKGSFTMNQGGNTTINLTDTNTDTNTTYSAGTHLSLSGTTFNVSSSTSNSGNKLVQRDSSGGFSCGPIAVTALRIDALNTSP